MIDRKLKIIQIDDSKIKIQGSERELERVWGLFVQGEPVQANKIFEPSHCWRELEIEARQEVISKIENFVHFINSR